MIRSKLLKPALIDSRQGITPPNIPPSSGAGPVRNSTTASFEKGRKKNVKKHGKEDDKTSVHKAEADEG